MSTSKKKPEPKAQGPPAEQQPTETGPVPREVPDAPMAAPAPSPMDRLAAVELANMELEARVRQLERNCLRSHGMR